MNLLSRIGRWIRRFRHRCGYGVHSPSDFFLITSVIYESLPYYAYRKLAQEDRRTDLPHYRTKVNRLLFRLANFYHPATLLEVGPGNGASWAYLQSARTSAKTASVDGAGAALNKVCKAWGKVDFCHIGFTEHPQAVFEAVYPLLHAGSCVVVGGIYEADRKEWWQSLLADERVRIAFDLYDIGILLFEERRFKQDYVVNFF